MKYKTELTNKVQLCFSLRKYQKNLSDNWNCLLYTSDAADE